MTSPRELKNGLQQLKRAPKQIFITNQLAHWINWVELYAGERLIYRTELAPEVTDGYVITVHVALAESTELRAKASCNVHGVWEGEPNIRLYNISTQKRITISDSKSLQGQPSIYGDYIVWIDDRNGNYDIYMCKISDLPQEEEE